MKGKAYAQPAAVVLGLNCNALGTVRSLAEMGVPVIAVEYRPTHNSIHTWMSSRTRLCRKIFLGDSEEKDALLDALIRLGSELGEKAVLFPSNDRQLTCISENRELLSNYYHFLIPAKETVRMINNKALFYDYAMKRAIEIPRTYFNTESRDIEKISREIRYPCLIKAFIRDSNWQHHFGDEKVILAGEPAELIARYAEVSPVHRDLIVQEVVPGSDARLVFSLTFFDRESRPLAMFTGRKLRQLPIRFGTSSMAESIWDARVAELTVEILRGLRYVGYGSIEFKYDHRDNKYKVMEITVGRTWYPHGLATACGINIPYVWYSYLLGREVRVSPHFREGVKWIDEYRDLISSYRHWKEGDITFGDWLKSYRGKKEYALASVNDPLPFIFVLLRVVMGALKLPSKALRKLRFHSLRSLFSRAFRHFGKAAKRQVRLLLHFCLFYSGLLALAMKIFARLKKRHAAIILFYHSLGNKGSYSLTDRGTQRRNVHEFRRQMSYLSRHYQVISMETLAATLHKRRWFSVPSMVVTIDDGYRDNYRFAYPILRKSRVTAMVYLTTGVVGTEGRLWTDQIVHALVKTKVEEFRLHALFGDELIKVRSPKQKADVTNRICEALKAVSNSQRLRLTDLLFETLQFDACSSMNGERPMLNWDEVKEMQDGGILFGAHTCTHPILSRMPLEQAMLEIAESKRMIEEKVGVAVKHFAFPNGRDIDFSEELKTFCKQIGFETIATCNYGVNDETVSPYALRRIGVESPLFVFAVEIARAFLFCR